MVKAAFVARILGRDFSALGVGGGRAAICGDAKSESSVVADVEGTTTGGESARGWAEWGPLYADIMARRENSDVHGLALCLMASENMVMEERRKISGAMALFWDGFMARAEYGSHQPMTSLGFRGPVQATSRCSHRV